MTPVLLASIAEALVSVSKTSAHPFSQQLFNHEQIDSCVQVQHCALAIPYAPV